MTLLARAVLLAAVLLLPTLAPQPACAQPSPTAILDRLRSVDGKPIDFHAAVFPETVYVGQQVTYQVAVMLSDQARSRLRRNPEFLPPELRGLLAYELGTPRRVPPRVYGTGSAYEAHVFQRALFAVAPGVRTVPSPQLSYALPQSASYFSREERYVVRAESAQLVVRALPVDGRPADFTGAVGVLRASARFDASTARVGDPLVLTVRIEGTGNLKLLPRPTVELSWATVVPGSERVQIDTSGSLVRGAREFDFLLSPSQPGAVTLPVVRYSYFNPYRGAYEVAETAPADLRVADGDLAATTETDEQMALPLRPWQAENARTLDTLPLVIRSGVLLLLLAVPLPALVVWLRRRRRRTVSAAAATVVSRPPVPDEPSPAGVARRVRRLLLEQLAQRLHVPSADLVAPATVERVLRRRGVTRATTREVLHLLDVLAAQGFGGLGVPPGEQDAEARARVVFERVNAEAVPHGRTRLWARRLRRAAGSGGAVVLLATLLGAQRVLAQDEATSTVACVSSAGTRLAAGAMDSIGPTPLDLLVGEGTAAYRAQRYSAAAQRFAAVAASCPRNVTALVNWGNAAWATNDTVAAVLAWQRAARLDPVAADVQERIALLPSGARGGMADVPMVPVLPLAAFAVAAWCTAWGFLFAAWRRDRAGASFTIIGALLVMAALAAGGTAWWGHRALDAQGLAVVRRPETLRAAPGFDANTAGGVSTGDVVRVSALQEGWQRVEHTDGRIGWIPSSRLAPLDVAPLETTAPIR